MQTRTAPESIARWALGIVTVILMASMGGGFLLLPLLLPAHIWAARRSWGVGRFGWLLLPAVSAAMVVWAGVYVALGESQPIIWLGPIGVALVVLVALRRVVTPRTIPA